jgi:hypothetical protein
VNRENARQRIPTSAELEAEGALAPPEHDASRGLFKFLRTRVFRVSDEVGGRKHVATAPPRPPQSPYPQTPPTRPTSPTSPNVTPSESASRTRRFRVSDEVAARKYVAPAPAPPPSPSPVPSGNSPVPPGNTVPSKIGRPRLFRVSDDVGRRKHVAAASTSAQAPHAPGATGMPGSRDASQPSAASLRPRPIRISESVRNRRGAGHTDT